VKISYSEILRYQNCPREHLYGSVQRLQRKTHSVLPWEGQVIHDFLAAHYRGKDLDIHYMKLVDAILEDPILFEDEQVDAVELLTKDFEYVKGYVEFWKPEFWTPLHIEETLEFELGERTIQFTPDLVVVDGNEDVWIVDHKSKSNYEEQSTLLMPSLQTLIYALGVQRIYPNLRGFIHNYIRRKLPAQPRLTKTGKTRVAYLKTIDTTYEILRDFLQDIPELKNDADHRARLAELRDQPNRFYWRRTTYLPEDIFRNAEFDLLDTLDLLELSHERDLFPRNITDRCKRCEFAQLCEAELLGYDTTELRTTLYEPRVKKRSPV
jgi:hypothetical protein